MPVFQGRLFSLYALRALSLVLVNVFTLLIMAYLIDRLILGHTHPFVMEGLYDVFNHWDARHYLKLSWLGYTRNGDDQVLLVFFPLYPWLISALNHMIGNVLMSALLISWVSTTVAAFALQSLLQAVGYSESQITRTLILWLGFPTAVFAFLPYTESLFMMWVLLSFWAAVRRRWFWATVTCILAGLTRSSGLFLIPALLIEALLLEKRETWYRATWLAFTPLGFLAYLGLNYWVSGDPFQFMAYQQAHWNQELMWPWQALARTISSIWNHPSSPVRTNFYEIRLLAMFGGTLVLGFASRRVRLSWVVYAWGCLILFLSAREAISIARYLWVLFPIFIQLGFWTRRPLIFQMMQIVSGLGFGLWFVLYGLGKGAF